MDRKFHFLKYNTFCQSGPFYFLGLERYLLKCFILRMRQFCFPEYKKNIFFKKIYESSVTQNTRKAFFEKMLKKISELVLFYFESLESSFLKYQKKFWKDKKLFNLGARKFHFLKCKKCFRNRFFLFFRAWV